MENKDLIMPEKEIFERLSDSFNKFNDRLTPEKLILSPIDKSKLLTIIPLINKIYKGIKKIKRKKRKDKQNTRIV